MTGVQTCALPIYHPGYCTIYLAQGRNLYLNTLLQGTKGLYITGDNTPINKNQCVLNAGANTYSGGTYINEEVTVQNTYGFGTGPITFAGGLLKANNTAGNFYFNFTNAVNIVADTPFGSANNWMVFSGPVNIQGTGKMLSVGNIDVTFSGVISGHDLNVINYTNATSTQNAIMILNGSSPNTYSGGTTVSYTPGVVGGGHSTLLDAQTAGSLGTGNVTVNAPSGGGLSCTLQMDSGSEMASTATLNVAIGATVNLTYGGTQTINALYVGGVQQPPGVYGASANNPSGVFAGTGLLSVPPPSSTALTLTSGLNPSTPGPSLTFTAVVTGSGPIPTGNVQLQVNGVNIGAPVALDVTGSAQLTIPGDSLAVGSYTITAYYLGDPFNATSIGSYSGNPEVIVAPITLYYATPGVVNNPFNWSGSSTD